MIPPLYAPQFLGNSLAQEECLGEIWHGADFPIWSPLDAFAAADTMQQALDASGTAQ